MRQQADWQDLDALIVSLAHTRWQKVAMIVVKALDRCHGEIEPETLAARIQALVESGQLEGQGDLSRWRHSEVRRPT